MSNAASAPADKPPTSNSRRPEKIKEFLKSSVALKDKKNEHQGRYSQHWTGAEDKLNVSTRTLRWAERMMGMDDTSRHDFLVEMEYLCDAVFPEWKNPPQVELFPPKETVAAKPQSADDDEDDAPVDDATEEARQDELDDDAHSAAMTAEGADLAPATPVPTSTAQEPVAASTEAAGDTKSTVVPMISKAHLDKAYKEGFEASEKGKALKTNPYVPGSPLFAEFDKGFNDHQRKLAEDMAPAGAKSGSAQASLDDHPDEIEKARAAGRQSGAGGALARSNPFPKGTSPNRHKAWKDGHGEGVAAKAATAPATEPASVH